MSARWKASGAALVIVASLAACVPVRAAGTRAALPTFTVPEAQLPDPLVLVASGDNGFSAEPSSADDASKIRRTLVAKIAGEHPAAIFLDGDLTLRGTSADYAAYAADTQVWRDSGARVYPALGDQEFAECAQANCLARWWTAFPALHGSRWYSVKLGSRVLAIVLDSNSSLLPGSAQRAWLGKQLAGSAEQVRFVLVVLHHPPHADPQAGKPVDDEPRPNEQALANYLSSIAADARAPTLVISGHINNYERFRYGGISYVVTGGGGDKTAAVERTDEDLYDRHDFPNDHYVRISIHDKKLIGEMVRLAESTIDTGPVWDTLDRFRLTARH
jgi:hypothetical protein